LAQTSHARSRNGGFDDSTGAHSRYDCDSKTFGLKHSGEHANDASGAAPRVASVRQDPIWPLPKAFLDLDKADNARGSGHFLF
jgi:hypothetical protein